MAHGRLRKLLQTTEESVPEDNSTVVTPAEDGATSDSTPESNDPSMMSSDTEVETPVEPADDLPTDSTSENPSPTDTPSEADGQPLPEQNSTDPSSTDPPSEEIPSVTSSPTAGPNENPTESSSPTTVPEDIPEITSSPTPVLDETPAETTSSPTSAPTPAPVEDTEEPTEESTEETTEEEGPGNGLPVCKSCTQYHKGASPGAQKLCQMQAGPHTICKVTNKKGWKGEWCPPVMQLCAVVGGDTAWVSAAVGVGGKRYGCSYYTDIKMSKYCTDVNDNGVSACDACSECAAASVCPRAEVKDDGTATAPACQDRKIKSLERPWHDAFGERYTCKWYSPSRCARYGSGDGFGGYTATQACCVCGGGIGSGVQCQDLTLEGDGEEKDWHDHAGDAYTCLWYEQRKQRGSCSKWGRKYPFMGMTATDACCACGGGDKLS